MTAQRPKMELGTRDEDERDDRPRGGLFRRSRMRGWAKHLHGYACPCCGATAHDRNSRDDHDGWHRDDREAWDEMTEKVEQQETEIAKLRGQMELMTELLGPALADVMANRSEGE